MALPVAAQGRPPGGNFSDPVIRAVDIAEPAIVRVGAFYQGSITFLVCGQESTLPGGGNTLTIAGLGTGAFINSNGDILTADHVVSIDKPDLDSAIIQALASDIATLLNANASCLNLGGTVTPDQISYQSIVDAGILFNTSYSAPQYLAWLNASYTGPDTNGATDATDPLSALMQAPHMTATLEGESSFTDNDLAVLQVGMSDTPNISLDNSDEVAVEDHLTAIGFPGNGDASHPDDTYDTTDLVTPSVDSLDVEAIKSNDNGSSIIQVSGPIEHGDSGGPALDANGNIVGIVSYSATDDPIGSFFLRSSNSARELLESTGIDTRTGTFEKQWRQAFDDYASTANGHWHTSASELDALSARYPDFRGVLPFKQYADQAALTEFSVGSTEPSLVALISLATALVALVGLLIVLLAMRSRRRQQRAELFPAAASASTLDGTYSAYSAYSPHGFSSYPPGYQSAATGRPYGYGHNGPYGVYAPGATPGLNSAPLRPTGEEFELPAATPQVAEPSSNANARASEVIWRNTCVNGHVMASVEAYCSVCGMPRASGMLPQPFNQ
ncbi:MAG: trypsin-like peptidase domain-containing protein [Ktedonobacterales bacterium]